jgi:pSer/pThr/pTyr-binding forkhead associated (FHA) protein
VRLLVIKGPDKGHCFVLFEGHSNLFGRGKYADNRLNDNHISRVHFEAEPLKNGRVLLTDLESLGGTFVNGHKVAEHYLKPGDVVRIGDTEWRLEGDSDADASEAKTAAPTAGGRPLVLSAERLPELVGAKLSDYEVKDVIANRASGLVFKSSDFKNDTAWAPWFMRC